MANKQLQSFLNRPVFFIFTILFSGTSLYFSNGLHGSYFWLLWIAPVPVLILSFNNSAKSGFFVAFTAYLIGRLSWFSYLVDVATLTPAIIFTILTALIYAGIVLLTRFSVIKTQSWWAVFAYPAFFTVFEFLLLKLSADGTAGSIAYSQSDFLPLIQIASVTGILGITFIVCLIPATIAFAWFNKNEKLKLWRSIVATVSLLFLVFSFGAIRLATKTSNNTILTGLVALDEKYHSITRQPDTAKEKITVSLYVKEINLLAAKGAKAIVLPERAINITKESATDIVSTLTDAAKKIAYLS